MVAELLRYVILRQSVDVQGQFLDISFTSSIQKELAKVLTAPDFERHGCTSLSAPAPIHSVTPRYGITIPEKSTDMILTCHLLHGCRGLLFLLMTT
jgi:hypothetical protein